MKKIYWFLYIIFILTLVTLALCLNYGNPQWSKHIYMFQSARAHGYDGLCHQCDDFFALLPRGYDEHIGYKKHWCSNGHLALETLIKVKGGNVMSRWAHSSGNRRLVIEGNFEENFSRHATVFNEDYSVRHIVLDGYYSRNSVHLIPNKNSKTGYSFVGGEDLKYIHNDIIKDYGLDQWQDWSKWE